MSHSNEKMKAEVMARMEKAMEEFKNSLQVLDSLDRDRNADDAFDLNDQVNFMFQKSEDLKDCMDRAKAVNGSHKV